MGKLTATKIKGLKPTSKQQIHYDGNYLYLFISPKGKKVFRVKGFRFNGKEINPISLGEFSDGKKGHLTLEEAREKTRQAIRDYKNGIDHGQKLKAAKTKAEYDQSNTLDDWFERWIETKSNTADSTQKDYKGRYAKWLSPSIGSRPVSAVSIDEVEALYKKIQKNCSPEMAKRCHIILNGIFTLTIKKRIATNNPTQLAKDEIKPSPENHFPAILIDNDIGELLHTMDNYNGMLSTIYAFRLIPYLMLRPMNLVSLKWLDIDFTEALIWIDASRMKTGKDHCVPYPKQVEKILRELYEFTGDNEYLLPSRIGKHHMHRDALSKALRDKGFRGKHTPHGYRSMATTWLYNNKFYDYAIEKQLAHTEANKVVRAYSRDDTMRYIDDRREMLQAWADHIDQLKAMPPK